jgi:transcription factor IIIB subunit 2
MKLLARQAIESNKSTWRGGRDAEILAAVCAYIICRSTSKPITLPDVADSIQCPVKTLGKAYKKLLDQLGLKLAFPDPSLFIEKACARLTLSPEDSTRLSNLAIRLIQIAKKDWIETGRKPTSITGGAILLAAQICKFSINTEVLSESLNVCEKTMLMRARELKDLLFHIGKKLPWGTSVTKRNFLQQLPAILRHVELLHRSEQQQDKSGSSSSSSPSSQILQDLALPPSFQVNEKKRALRRCKLEEAKIRLSKLTKALGIFQQQQQQSQQFQQGEDHRLSEEEDNGEEEEEEEERSRKKRRRTTLDNEDLVIERLLLAGCSEDQILQGNYDTLLASSQPLLRAVTERQLGSLLRQPHEQLLLQQQHSSPQLEPSIINLNNLP